MICKVRLNLPAGGLIRLLSIEWSGRPPSPGQFFMIKPRNTGVFLARPISVYSYKNGEISFVVDQRGKGTEAICALRDGETAELIGPLGNGFKPFLRAEEKRTALVAGGAGIAPLAFLAKTIQADFFAGFRRGWISGPEDRLLEGLVTQRFTFFAEDAVIPRIIKDGGAKGSGGVVTSGFEAKNFETVFCCGPRPMMKAVYESCASAGIRCIVSMERRMACGVGACLGCAVETKNGNRRCCADGPVFDAAEVLW
ncbi:MAG: dihydroorotate dehydrogenase electron transfer subunit [Spirochaetaceae bacterium]|nr:dihydroorotate dehydrogenase electron transfer subunit [Spirochaetaceae bacterium]